MTAITLPSRPPILDAFRRAVRPSEGWLSLAFVAFMSLAVAWSIDDAGWVLGQVEYTDFLAPAALAGVLVGAAGAIAGLSRWATHVLTALVAAIVLPFVVGTILPGVQGSPYELYQATAASTRAAWIDLAILNQPFTTQIGHHLLALGILAWGTGHFASYAVFGHHRPLDAFIVLGIVLLGSMALTRNDQLWYLVGFSIAGLLLLSRHHAIEESSAWIRRRIGDPAAVRSLYQTGGTVFVLVAVVGSLSLTASASSDPLRGAWSGFEGWLIDVSQSLQRFLPIGGASRPLGTVVFGPQAQITGAWSPGEGDAFQVTLPRDETGVLYWRAWAYDSFSPRGWSTSKSVISPRAAEEDLLGGLGDDPALSAGRRELTMRIEPIRYEGRYAVSPEAPLRLDRPSQMVLVGDTFRFGAIDLGGAPGPYTLTASISIVGDTVDPHGLTESNLIAAPETYPEDVVAMYTNPGVVLGPEATALLDEVRAASPSRDPYDMARTMERMLRSNRFQYDTDVTAELASCGNRNIVDCFALTKRGFCQYYASTMAILLREDGIPTRMVQGFLPGDRDPTAGVEVVANSKAHAWVEVYFPGYGWVRFDPTGGGISQIQSLPVGAQQSPLPTLPSPSRAPGDGANENDDPSRPRAVNPQDVGSTSSPAMFIVIAVLLAGIVGGLGVLAWRRGPRGEVGPDAAWRGVARLAARFGFGPRPTQTVYEYAAALGEVLPMSRPELHTVAQAKVEVSYGRRVLGEDRMRLIRDAHRHLRVALLRLAFRRRDRRAHRLRRD
ncbi:MAG TPA: transglutaminase domain-containing protein [Candidatus Limnocylindrales bacterium]